MPVLQVRGKSIVTYLRTESDGRKGLQLFRSLNMKEQQKKTYSGRMTVGAKKRCTKAINLLVQGTPRRWITNPINNQLTLHQLTFVTLTVSDTEALTGKEAYRKLLAPFLQWLRKTKSVNTYIWKAEFQKNGQLHYHLTCPDFIHYKEIRAKWNECQRKAGIIARYRNNQLRWHCNGFRVREDLLSDWPLEKQKTAYARGMANDWQDPNSTDVHKVYKVKDMASYLVKEISKGLQNEIALGGKVWDCSKNLSDGKYFSVEMKQAQFTYLESAVNEGLCEKFEGERFCIYKFNQQPVKEALLTKEDMKQYKAWLHVLRESITFKDPE